VRRVRHGDASQRYQLRAWDFSTFASLAPGVRAAAVLAGSASNLSIRVGVGAMWTDFADGYFSDWTSNLLSVVDFFGEDVYPDTSGGSPAYATRLQGFVPYTQAALAMGKAVVANESSSLRLDVDGSRSRRGRHLLGLRL
jgi:hypothetical protein